MTFTATILTLSVTKPLPLGEGVGDGGSPLLTVSTHPSIPSLTGGEV